MKTSRPPGLPEFRRPPLVEVALALHFEPLPGLTAAHIGLLWEKYRERLPRAEEHPPLGPVVENVGAAATPTVQIDFTSKPPTPRVWFLSETGTKLIQIQNDRIIHNWRRTAQEPEYPRYEPVREEFRQEFNVLADFVETEQLGELSIRRCEIAYVNHFEYDAETRNGADPERVFANWQSLPESVFLPTPEAVALRWSFPISSESGAGQLEVMARPVSPADGPRIWVMELMAGGRPTPNDIEGAFRFFNVGREWIVRAFTDLTTDFMHRRWERTDA